MDDKFIRKTIQTMILIIFLGLFVALSYFSAALIAENFGSLHGKYSDGALLIASILKASLGSQFGPILVVILSAWAVIFLKCFYNEGTSVNAAGNRKLNNLGRIMFLLMIGISINGLLEILLLNVWLTTTPVVVKADRGAVIGAITALTSFNVIYIAQMMGLNDEKN